MINQFNHPANWFVLIIILNVSAPNVSAQNWVQNDAVFNASGVPSVTFSAPRFADLDGDSDYDLILGGTDVGLIFLQNTGSVTNPQFAVTDFVTHGITALEAEIGAAADMDGDGDMDLITGGYTGLTYFENTGSVTNPVFTRDSLLFALLNVGLYPVPTLADLNGDGTIDLLIGLSESGSIKYYLNIGTTAVPAYSETSVISPGIDVGLYAYPCLSDPDGDDDWDLVIGRDDLTIYFYFNSGTPQNPQWIYDATYCAGLALNHYFTTPCLVDLSGDGIEDLIYGHYGGPLQYFINTGTATVPVWSENTSVFGGIIDVGGASNPFLYDFDGDIDLDLITGFNFGGIKYYRNTGTVTSPAWEADHSDFSSIDLSIYSSVTVGDLNDDGNPELLMGDVGGSLYFYDNNGSQFTLNNSHFNGINIGWWLIPRFADMDADLDFDVVVSNDSGDLHYFENQGTIISAEFVLISDYFTGVSGPSNSAPAVGDYDSDGDLDILLGGISGDLRYYENTGTIPSPTWTDNSQLFSVVSVSQNATPAFGDLDGDGDLDLSIGAYDGTFHYFENTNPVVGIDPVSDLLPNQFKLKSVYPNPFNNQISFAIFSPGIGAFSIEIYNLYGQHLFSKNAAMTAGESVFRFRFPPTTSSGVYIYRASFNGQNTIGTTAGKIIYLK